MHVHCAKVSVKYHLFLPEHKHPWPTAPSDLLLPPKQYKGGPQNPFSEKVRHLALPVSWAAKKRKKSLMFILHFRLF